MHFLRSAQTKLTQLDKFEALQWSWHHLGEHRLQHFLDRLAARGINIWPELPHDAAQESDVLGIFNVDAMLGQARQGVGRSLGGSASVVEAGAAIKKGSSAQAGDGSASAFAGVGRRWVVRGVEVRISPAADGEEISEG